MGCVRRDHRPGGNTPLRWDLGPLPQICAEALYDIAELTRQTTRLLSGYQIISTRFATSGAQNKETVNNELDRKTNLATCRGDIHTGSSLADAPCANTGKRHRTVHRYDNKRSWHRHRLG